MTASIHSDPGYQRSLEVHKQIEALYPRVEAHRAYFRGMTQVDPNLPRPPGTSGEVRLDHVVCVLAIKAATTKRAVLAVCELGDGDNAIALARVLLENACLLEWLIRGDGRRRLETYAMFLSVAHERIVAIVNRHRDRFIGAGADPNMASDPYHRAIWTHVFRDRKGRPTKGERPTWNFDRLTRRGEPASVRALFEEIADSQTSFEYDILYGALGSDIVHSGPFTTLTRMRQRTIGDRATFSLAPMPISDMCTIALASSNVAMFLVLDSLTQYIGLDLSAELASLKAKSHTDPYSLVDGE